MGMYINLISMTKEDWLALYGELFDFIVGWGSLKEDYLPVCLVNNGMFTAAGICYSEKEFKAFLYPDGRAKKWYQAPISELHRISPEFQTYLMEERK